MKDLKTFLLDNSSNAPKNDKIFTVIKPGFENLVETIESIFKKYGYKVYQMKTKRLLLSEAKELYKIHKKEKFYDDLCKYMSSGITIAYILQKKSEDIFEEFSELKDKIRKDYGESNMRNVLHSSDSYENMINEASIYFNCFK